MFAGRAHQHHRGPGRRSTSPCACPAAPSLEVDGHDVVADVHEVLDRMGELSRAHPLGRVDRGDRQADRARWSTSGSADRTSVRPWPTRPWPTTRRRDSSCRFVSNIDPVDLYAQTHDLDPADTLFVVSSKTFTTLETLTNATAARRVAARRPRQSRTTRRWPVTSSRSRPTQAAVAEFGIDPANMFGFWDWVGGRYSVDSAIGFSLMVAIGPEAFAEHAGRLPHHRPSTSRPRRSRRTCRSSRACSTSGTTTCFGAQTHAVLPYSQRLARFPAYLQQLTMESNGKSVRRDGSPVSGQTGRDLLGRAGHQRPARLLPAHPPGDQADPRRLHRVRRVDPRGRATNRTC